MDVEENPVSSCISDFLLQHLMVAKMEENRQGAFYSRLAIVLHLVFDIHVCAEVQSGIVWQIIPPDIINSHHGQNHGNHATHICNGLP